MFWYHMSGLILFPFARILSRYVQTTRQPVPGSVGWMILTVSTLGIIAVPVSGFWLMAGIGAGIIILDYSSKK